MGQVPSHTVILQTKINEPDDVRFVGTTCTAMANAAIAAFASARIVSRAGTPAYSIEFGIYASLVTDTKT